MLTPIANCLTIYGAPHHLNEFITTAKSRNIPKWSDALDPERSPDVVIPLNFHALRPVPEHIQVLGYFEQGKNWSIQHWGCPWNLNDEVYFIHTEEYCTYCFLSFSSPPIKLIEYISKQFHHLSLHLIFRPMDSKDWKDNRYSSFSFVNEKENCNHLNETNKVIIQNDIETFEERIKEMDAFRNSLRYENFSFIKK